MTAQSIADHLASHIHKMAPNQPIVKHQSHADGITTVTNFIPDTGTFIPQHSHCHDHTSIIASGSARVWLDGAHVCDLKVPETIEIKAGTKHLFQTLEPNTTLFCVHNTSRTGEIEIKEEHHIVGKSMNNDMALQAHKVL